MHRLLVRSDYQYQHAEQKQLRESPRCHSLFTSDRCQFSVILVSKRSHTAHVHRGQSFRLISHWVTSFGAPMTVLNDPVFSPAAINSGSISRHHPLANFQGYLCVGEFRFVHVKNLGHFLLLTLSFAKAGTTGRCGSVYYTLVGPIPTVFSLL